MLEKNISIAVPDGERIPQRGHEEQLPNRMTSLSRMKPECTHLGSFARQQHRICAFELREIPKPN